MEERVSNLNLSLDLFTTIITKSKDCGIIHWGNNSRVRLPINDYKLIKSKNDSVLSKISNYRENITPIEIDYTFIFNDEFEYGDIIVTLIGDNAEIDITLFEKEYKVYENTILNNSTVIIKLYSNTFLYIEDTSYDQFIEFCLAYESNENENYFLEESYEEILKNPLYFNEGVFYNIKDDCRSCLFNIDYAELSNFTTYIINKNSIIEIENEYVKIRLSNLKYSYANHFSNHVEFISGNNKLVIQYVRNNGPYHPNNNILVISVFELNNLVVTSINNDIKIYEKDANKYTYEDISSYNERRDEELEYQREQDRQYYSSLSSEERESLNNLFEY